MDDESRLTGIDPRPGVFITTRGAREAAGRWYRRSQIGCLLIVGLIVLAGSGVCWYASDRAARLDQQSRAEQAAKADEAFNPALDKLDPSDALPLLQSASVAGRSAVRQRKARRVQQLGGREFALPPLCAASGGYSLHAGVLIGARDRKGLRRLAGDLGLGSPRLAPLRAPPLALDRVEALPGDRVRIPLKRP